LAFSWSAVQASHAASGRRRADGGERTAVGFNGAVSLAVSGEHAAVRHGDQD
jgi:hypothetical protein